MAEWLDREFQNLLIAVGRTSSPRSSRIFANLRLVSVFIVIVLFRAAFCRVLASVCEAKLRLSVYFALAFLLRKSRKF